MKNILENGVRKLVVERQYQAAVAYENALKYGIVSGSFINEETYRVLDNSERSIKCEYCQTHIVERDKFHPGNCPECGAPLFGK